MLEELAKKYGTDKTSEGHGFNGKNYMNRYEFLFSPIREKVKSILEIGVLGGASLRVWEEYFPNATIYGLDIEPACKKFETDRIKIFTGSQDDPDVLNSIIKDCGSLDIIIDDGSHLVEHLMASFEWLFTNVGKGGYYIMEDTGNSYVDLTTIAPMWPGMYHNTCSFTNDRKKFNDWLSNKIQGMDHQTGIIEEISIYCRQVVFKKI